MSEKKETSGIAVFGLRLAVLAGIAAVMSGFGHRFGWWNFLTGFTILKWAAIGALLAAVMSLTGALVVLFSRAKRGFFTALIGLIIGLATAAVPWSWLHAAAHVPPIHDITTDTKNPPRFMAVLALRKNAPNPAAYGGPEVAEQQLKAYPDIVPLILNTLPGTTFDKALRVASDMGWKIVDAQKKEGRIEATATTFWFGFKDDIVIRITPDGNGSRVDIRSESRVGKSDLGTNAERIRKFLALMRTAG